MIQVYNVYKEVYKEVYEVCIQGVGGGEQREIAGEKNKESNEAYDYCKQENERRLRMRRNKFENEQEGEVEKGKQD